MEELKNQEKFEEQLNEEKEAKHLKEEKELETLEKFDINTLRKAKETQCSPCILSVAAGMIIGEYCDPEKQDCEALVEDFTMGYTTLRRLAEDLNADPEILKVLEEEGVPLDKTLKQIIEEENWNEKEIACQLSLKNKNKNSEENSK